MNAENQSGFKAFTSSTNALAKFVRVKLVGVDIIDIAGAGDPWIGVTVEAVPASSIVTVRLRNSTGSFYMTASGAISTGAYVASDASGQVKSSAAKTSFIANDSATAQGDIIECLPADRETNNILFQATGLAAAGNITAASVTAETSIVSVQDLTTPAVLSTANFTPGAGVIAQASGAGNLSTKTLLFTLSQPAS